MKSYQRMTPAERQEWLAEAFEFELCHECGGDHIDHVCGPDALGLPHAYCLYPLPDDDRAEAEMVIRLARYDRGLPPVDRDQFWRDNGGR